MTNEELFARYGVEWHDYHGICASRRRQQLHTLRQFAIRLGPERTMLDVTSEDIRSWLDMKRDLGLMPGTLRLHINYFRPFYTWAHGVGLIDRERLLDIRSIRPPRGANKTVPRPYNARERARFWQDFEQTYPWTKAGGSKERAELFFGRYLEGRSRWFRARAYCVRLQAEAIVALAIYGGLRRIEIFNLDLDDMDPENEYVVVHSAMKGRDALERDRVVPWVGQPMRDAVEAWTRCRGILESHAGGFDHDRPWLWLGSREGYLWKPQPLDHFVGTVAKCGDWKFHRMRHTAATEMLRAEMPLHAVSRILGHANVAQTLGYTAFLSEDLVHQARLSQSKFENAMRRS